MDNQQVEGLDNLSDVLFPERRLSDFIDNELKVNVLNSGFPTLNENLFLKKGVGEFIVVAARPSHGKSAFVFQLAEYVSRESNVLCFSLEMSRQSIITRLASQHLNCTIMDIQRGNVNPFAINKFRNDFKDRNYFIIDKSGLDIADIVNYSRDFKRRYESLDLVVVDYLQLVRIDQGSQRHEQIAHVSQSLKLLSKELNCPVVAAAQVNRGFEQRALQQVKQMPSLGDIKDSGAIEQDADVVLFIQRPSKFNPEEPPDKVVLDLAKNRNGSTNRFDFTFLATKTKFCDPIENDEEDQRDLL